MTTYEKLIDLIENGGVYIGFQEKGYSLWWNGGEFTDVGEELSGVIDEAFDCMNMGNPLNPEFET